MITLYMFIDVVLVLTELPYERHLSRLSICVHGHERCFPTRDSRSSNRYILLFSEYFDCQRSRILWADRLVNILPVTVF